MMPLDATEFAPFWIWGGERVQAHLAPVRWKSVSRQILTSRQFKGQGCLFLVSLTKMGKAFWKSLQMMVFFCFFLVCCKGYLGGHVNHVYNERIEVVWSMEWFDSSILVEDFPSPQVVQKEPEHMDTCPAISDPLMFLTSPTNWERSEKRIRLNS